MAGFSRRARWLNALFPASEIPAITDPSVLSDDVSLVQAYDGGGLGFRDRASMFFQVDKTGNGVSVFIIQVPEDSICRVYAVSVFTITAPVSTVQLFTVEPDKNQAVMLAPEVASPAVAAGSIPFDLNRSIVLPPGVNLQGNQFGGGAGTVIRYTAYGVIAPVGTVFAN